MKLVIDALSQGGFLLEILGIAGLGMTALAGARLARRQGAWGAVMLAGGAALLLLGRLAVLLWPALLSPPVRHALSRSDARLLTQAPMALLTFGFAGVVWGLWGYERSLRETKEAK